MEQVRSRTADFLKGVAIIAMVQLVLVEYFARPEILNGLTGKISLFIGGPPVAPLFLTVMGYYIAHQQHSIRYHVIRGIKLIFLGIFLNVARNAYLLYEIASGKVTQDIWHIIFGTDILILAGISLIVMAFLVKLLRGHVLAYLTLIIVFLLLQYIIPPVEKAHPQSIILPFFYGKYPQAQFPFIPWFAYVLAGYTFYLFKQFFVSDQFKHNKTVNMVLAILSGILLLISLPFGYSVSIRHMLFYHHGILFFLFCVNFLFWWLLSAKALVDRFQNKITGYLEFLGRNVTAFYVLFMIIAGNMGVFYQKKENYLMLIIFFVLLMVVTSLLVRVWERIRS
ncbi:DUF1624 domain-containing protein [Candidatus Sulfidibacterium hydrothermale]|uniref:DUF1624 domain-containing protein n=1 Tax=Candidatus Sulfidibacterium hydrothermale TaxID=2875962 RepID=UPI001F0A98AA|nr:DUF1624 domain-containing protein [Candidatus Sulfidibacterium hydrothermale]UBM62853.1 DUF1624 domain-containing protein [Candidatus Sulfidibacterium hydrothermale]